MSYFDFNSGVIPAKAGIQQRNLDPDPDKSGQVTKLNEIRAMLSLCKERD